MKEKLSKEDRQDLRKANSAMNDLVRRAKKAGALVSDSQDGTSNSDDKKEQKPTPCPSTTATTIQNGH
jgi:hypothetical protein